MSDAPRHQVFTVTWREPEQTTVRQVVCVCGAMSSWDHRDTMLINWFGAHCYSAALDRAVEILKR